MEKTTISGYEAHKKLSEILSGISCRKFLLVCDSAFKFLNLQESVDKLSVPYEVFSDFTPNPLYEDVKKGVKKFQDTACDAIVVIGGGSAIDVAKCIKLFCLNRADENHLEQPFCDTGVPLIAIPTTAGTGSEATHFAVIYANGQKLSIAHESLIPDYVILDHSLLKTLPLYQKKCTMLDALCHGIESWWSVNSTDESKKYSQLAIRTIMENKDEYLSGSEQAGERILLASNFAGKAINITKTTAAHAMSYKVTSLYGLPHGHAAAICLPWLWQFMTEHMDNCVDKRGAEYVSGIFNDIAAALGAENVKDAIEKFKSMLKDMAIESPLCKKEELEILASSVNADRLKNNPVAVSGSDFYNLYAKVLKYENN